MPETCTPTYIEPINQQQQALVIEKTRQYIELASDFYARPFKNIDVLFNLSGRNAGMYRVCGQQRWIRYNPYIFARYFTDGLHTTVPHEVAHYVTDQLYSLKKIRPHGVQWKNVMHVLGAKPQVTGNYSLAGIPQRRQKRYTYQCECRQHQISAIRHRRIVNRQATYYCKQCKQLIQAVADSF